MKLWTYVLGSSKLALRGFSAFFAFLLMALLYKAGSCFFYSRKTGLIAALLAATNFFLIWSAGQCRMYTLAAFVGLASYYFFIKLTREFRKPDCILYILFAAVGFYTHPWLLLVFLSQVLALIIYRRQIKQFNAVILSQITILLLSLPGILIMRHHGNMGVSSWIGKANIITLLNSFKYLSFGSYWPYLIFSIIALCYMLRGKTRASEDVEPRGARAKKIQEANVFMLLYLVFPLLAALVISQFKPIYANGRYEMIVLPAFILILASLWSRIQNRFIIILMVISLIICAYRSVASDREFVRSFKANDETVAADILNRLEDGDSIVATDLSYASFNYYMSRLNKARRKKFHLFTYPKETKIHPGWQDLNRMRSDKQAYSDEANSLITELLAKTRKGGTIWVLYKLESPVTPILFEKLSANFEQTSVKKLPDPHQPMWFDIIFSFRNR